MAPWTSCSAGTPDMEPGAAATAALLSSAIERITRARDLYLARLSLERVIEAIDAAVARWLEPASPLLTKAVEALPNATGYSAPMIREGLPELLKPFRADGLRALVRGELGDAPVLDAGRVRRVIAGPRLITHVLAGNLPAVAVEAMVHALLVRSASLVKLSSRDPLFPGLFAHSLAEADRDLAASIAVLGWKGGEAALEILAFGASDAVVAYGGDEAIEGVRRLVPPGVRFIPQGPRIGFGIIGREALSTGGLTDLAAAAAWDVSFFDQQGCVSPHAILVERGGAQSPWDFAVALAREMGVLEGRLPRGRLRTEEASAIQQVRGTFELRRAAGQHVAVLHSSDSTAWTVLYEEDAAPAPSCLNRVVRVLAVDDLSTVPASLLPLRRYLQTVGVAAAPERIEALIWPLSEAGVTRVCPLGRMQHPPATWRHDGRPSLLDLVRWVDVEQP